MISNVFQVDTKGICLLCLYPCHSTLTPTNSNTLTSMLGFEKVLRYLDVNPAELLQKSRQTIPSGADPDIPNTDDDVGVEVTLCFGCSLVTEKFHELHEQYELIKLQFNKCIKAVHQSIKTGDESDARVNEYNNRMMPQQSNQFNTRFASNLRQETLKKCFSRFHRTPVTGVAPAQVNAGFSSVDPTPAAPLAPSASSSGAEDSSEITSDSSHVSPPKPSSTVVNVNAGGGFLPLTPSSSYPNINCTLLVTPPTGGGIPPNVLRNSENIGRQRETTAAPPAASLIPYTNLNSRDVPLPLEVNGPAKCYKRCQKCSAQLRPQTVRQHMVVIHPEVFVREYVPPHLHSKCTTNCKQVLRKLIVTQPNTENGIACPYCPRHIKSRRVLKYHVVRNHVRKFAEYLMALGNPPTERQAADTPIEVEGPSNPPVDLAEGTDVIDLFTPTLPSTPSTSAVDNWLLCVFCRKTFSSQAQLVRHMAHDSCRDQNRRLVKCYGRARAQLTQQSPGEMVKCPFCGYLSHGMILQRHMYGRHFVPVVMPSMPGRSEAEVGLALEQIMENIRTVDNQCPWCDVKWMTFDMLKRHLRENHFTELVQQITAIL